MAGTHRRYQGEGSTKSADKRKITAYLEFDIWERLNQIAKSDHRSLSAEIEMILQGIVEDHDRQSEEITE